MRITGLSDHSDCEHATSRADESLAYSSTNADDTRGRGSFAVPWNGSRTLKRVPFWKVKPLVYVYTCRDDATIGKRSGKQAKIDGLDPAHENIANRSRDKNATDDDMFGDTADSREGSAAEEPPPTLYSTVLLPSVQIEDVWETLILDPGIKQYLLEYISSGCLFSSRGVDKNLVTWNRVALLHGPPGSGKTSLSRALAHKLAIRFECSQAILLEIHANNLFRCAHWNDAFPLALISQSLALPSHS